MILYNENGDFVAISKEELYFLGFEDIDEFKSLYSDVADLFVNKAGYIFKFKNFSWIDYALHSGAPKKSVVIKLKNGNEVEATLKITELFLYSPKDKKDTIMYGVELIHNTISSMEKLPKQPVPIVNETLDNPNEKNKFTLEKDNEPQKIEQNIKTLEEDFSLDTKFEIPQEEPELSIINEEGVLPNIKTNNEQSIFPPLEDFQSEENLYKEPEEKNTFQEDIKLKIDDEVFSNENDNKIDTIDSVELKALKEDIQTIDNMYQEEEKKEDADEIEFNILDCVEKLDLDINLITELLEEYFHTIELSTPKMKTYIKENKNDELYLEIYMLKGISDNLHLHVISNLLHEMLIENDFSKKSLIFQKFEKTVEKIKEELI